MNSVSVPAQLMGIRSLADGGVSLSFHTAEITASEKVVLMNLHTQAGWLLFNPDNEVPAEDIPEHDSGYETKTPGQRLRAVLFLLWKQEGEKGSFNEYYEKSMEKFITLLKGRLE